MSTDNHSSDRFQFGENWLKFLGGEAGRDIRVLPGWWFFAEKTEDLRRWS